MARLLTVAGVVAGVAVEVVALQVGACAVATIEARQAVARAAATPLAGNADIAASAAVLIIGLIVEADAAAVAKTASASAL